MLAPAMEATHPLTGQPGHVDLGAALGTFDGAPGECRDFFTQDDDGRTFGHGCTRGWAVLDLRLANAAKVRPPLPVQLQRALEFAQRSAQRIAEAQSTRQIGRANV